MAGCGDSCCQSPLQEVSLMSVSGVTAAQSAVQQAGGGATPTLTLHSLQVGPIPMKIAKTLVTANHYSHTFPGGSQLAFGVFSGPLLLGVLVLGVGSFNSSSLVVGADRGSCITLTRLWMSDELPKNSESRVTAIVLRSLARHTDLKFILTYADPAQGHVGTIYQATGWLYTGFSDATAYYTLHGGNPRHSRSFSHAFGTRSMDHFRRHGVDVRLVQQEAKHRYIYFLDPDWRASLKVPALPYPKKEKNHGNS